MNYALELTLFWLAFLVLCCFRAATVLRSVLGLYSKDVASYSVETDYLTWETPFPAVTVCEYKINLEKTKAYLTSEGLSTSLSQPFFKEVLFWNERFCKCDYKEKDLNKKYVIDFEKFTNNIRDNCTQMLADCSWDGERFPCCDRFLPLETEVGVCYSFNSQAADPNSKVISLNRNQRNLPKLVFTVHNAQYNSLKIHASEETFSTPTMNDVLGRDNSFLKPAKTELPVNIDISLKVQDHTMSDLSVSTLPPFLRGCLYKNERPAFAHLWPFKIYSMKTCVLYCRALWQMERCNCTHNLMPRLEEAMDSGLECDCPLACEETSFKLVNILHEHTDEVGKGAARVNVNLGSLLSIRARRHALRTILSLVVDIGGLGGVFFGASLLSVMEIIYLFFIRKGP